MIGFFVVHNGMRDDPLLGAVPRCKPKRSYVECSWGLSLLTS